MGPFGTPRSAVIAGFLAVALSSIAVPVFAQEPSEGETDISLSATEPTVTVLVGDTFDLVFSVSNEGPADAADALLNVSIPPEMEFGGVVSSNPTDSCAFTDQPGGYARPMSETSASPGYYGGYVECLFGTLEPDKQRSVTVTLTRRFARETWMTGWISTSTYQSNYDNDYADLYFAPDTSKPADVALRMSGPADVKVAESFDVRLDVTNLGPQAAESVTLTYPIPYGTEYVSTTAGAGDTCTLIEYGGDEPVAEERPAPVYTYSELTCDLGTMQANEQSAVTVTLRRTSGWDIYNSAWVSTTNYDTNYENDYAYLVLPPDPSAASDIAVTALGPEPTPLVGNTFELRYTIANHGPAAAGDVWFHNYLSEGMEFQSASSSDPNDSCSEENYPTPEPLGTEPATPTSDSAAPVRYGGAVVTCSLGALATDETATITMTFLRTRARELWNNTWASSSNYEVNYENNSTELVIEADKTNPADVSLTKVAPDSAPVGSTFDFTLTIHNSGPSGANDVVVVDQLPYGVEFESASSSDGTDTCTYSGESYEPKPEAPTTAPIFFAPEVVCELGSLGVDETTTITISVTRNTEWEIHNGAWVSISNYDPDYENDFGSAVVPGKRFDDECPKEGDATGTEREDNIVISDCDATAGPGADSVEVAADSRSDDMTVRAGAGADTLTVALTSAGRTPRTLVLRGGRGPDRFLITAAPGAGNTTIYIYGGRGNDAIDVELPEFVDNLIVVVRAGAGADTARSYGPDGETTPGVTFGGGPDRDLLLTGAGPDRLRGGDGRDWLEAGAGDDRLTGGSGRDVCRDGPGRDTVDC